jgi:outer membrane autotransporter protein
VALTFNRSDVQTFAGQITGSGAVNQIGAGTTILTANNTYTGGTTISAGTLQLGDGGATGGIVGNVANNGALSFNRSDAVTFAGLISGSGTVNQNGSGATILTAQNTYGGPTNVNSGVLRAGAASTLSPNSAVNMAAAGTLDLNGYSQTVAGVTNAGLINMGTATTPGTTLTTPNYVGQGGRIAMNTLLGGDGSPSDRLVINGGTASGSSSLIVTNAGGAGAVTTGNGILLVDAVNGGTTAASAFTLGNAGGYVAAGPYAYTLQRSSVDGSGLQNWYLRSTVDCAAAPSNPACKDPEPPVPPNPPVPPVPPNPPTPVPPAPPNYRPEVSTAVATPELALRYGSTFLDSLHERIGEARYALPSTPAGSNSLVWGRVIGVTGERNGSNSGILGSRGPDYDYKIYGLQSGVDLYRRANANGSMDHAGAYVAFGRATADVDHLDGRSAGQAAMNGVTLGGYWTHIGKEGWYVDAVIQGTRYDVDNGRSPAGYNLDTRGFGFATSLEGGYPFRLNDEWVIEPQAQLVFQNVNLNDANDGAAKIRFNDVDSLRGRLGVRLARTVELDPGPDGKRVATTWVRASLVNEFLTNPTTEFSSQNGYVPFRADMKGASVQLNLGADVGVKRNVSVYGSVGSEISLRGDGQNFNGKLGVKIAF